MSDKRTPIVIDKFDLADSVRVGKKRMAGVCSSLIDTTPQLSGGEGVRSGYTTQTFGSSTPTGLEITKVVGIQNPTQEDVYVGFANNSGKKVWMNPYWKNGSKVTNSNLNLSNKETGLTITAVNTASNTTNFKITGGAESGYGVSDYYNGWIIHNVTRSLYMMVKDYDGIYFTKYNSILNWQNGDSVTLYGLCFHDNLLFAPSYNNDKTNPPCVIVDGDIIYLSGGQSSDDGNNGIVIIPKLNRTYFPGISEFSINGTYVSEERLNEPNGRIIVAVNDSSIEMPSGTYYVGVAAMYDGYQLGELQENDGQYIDHNFGHLKITYKQNPLILNKRITGFYLFVAYDNTDTTDTGRIAPYVNMGNYLPIDDSSFDGWSYLSVDNEFTIDYYHNNNSIINRGLSYITMSGMTIGVDTSYSYSMREVIGGRHYISNVYIGSESVVNRFDIFTNPEQTGGIAKSLFPNEKFVYRIPSSQTFGTKITSLKQIGTSEILCIKDRGIALGRIIPLENNVDISWTTISNEIGLTTAGEVATDDDGWIYFPDYNSIYRYRNGVLQDILDTTQPSYPLQKLPYNDWKNDYAGISNANKEQATVYYIPDQKVIHFLFGNTTSATSFNGLQYAFYLSGYWREMGFYSTYTNSVRTVNMGFRWATHLQDGTILVTSAGSSPVLFKFSKTTFTDHNGTTTKEIFPYIDTGLFIVSGNEFRDFILDQIIINKTLSGATSGTLDVSVVIDTNGGQTFTDQSKTDTRLALTPSFDAIKRGNRLQIKYNSGTSKENLSSGTQFQIDSIEIYGDIVPKLELM